MIEIFASTNYKLHMSRMPGLLVIQSPHLAVELLDQPSFSCYAILLIRESGQWVSSPQIWILAFIYSDRSYQAACSRQTKIVNALLFINYVVPHFSNGTPILLPRCGTTWYYDPNVLHCEILYVSLIAATRQHQPVILSNSLR